ncbi:MAG: hypothetical protein ISS36_03845 [Candidatus Aenigmarchaeota archaeon]|nr:hypothetical protein [Candidatus Aenigmarchaeota archaeon]
MSSPHKNRRTNAIEEIHTIKIPPRIAVEMRIPNDAMFTDKNVSTTNAKKSIMITTSIFSSPKHKTFQGHLDFLRNSADPEKVSGSL